MANNSIVDLAILLEPLYWPRISGSYTMEVGAEEQFDTLVAEHKKQVQNLLASLDVTFWERVHQFVRLEAAQIDKNGDHYLLLRLAKADRRLKLKGDIGHALWLRHMAEVIRRGFEEFHSVQWAEEDIAFGIPIEGSRAKSYGLERPLDTEPEAVPRLAWYFGLLTSSVVRWYVEGQTEYHAILHMIPKHELFNIELVNLRGDFGGKGNGALKLSDWLEEDLKLRRFSMISFDCDVEENVKVIRNQIKAERVVGMVTANNPDFEFYNFSLDELVEIAARIDEANGISGDALRDADWCDVTKGKEFEERYKKVSARRPTSLKGKEWGEALAEYAFTHPHRDDTNAPRPFCGEIYAAYNNLKADYDEQKRKKRIERETFELVDRST